MLEGFERDDLTRALERRRAVQGTLMRSTIHLVSPRDYWSLPGGRRAVAPRVVAQDVGPSRAGRERRLRRRGARGRARGTHVAPRGDRRAAARRRAGRVWSGIWIPLVRVPPSGTWERRRADLFRLAAEWIAPEEVTEEDGLEHLLRRYLAAFGPARWRTRPTGRACHGRSSTPAAERLPAAPLRGRGRQALCSTSRACASPGRGRPVRRPRFLGTWDAVLLVHARRTQSCPSGSGRSSSRRRQPQSWRRSSWTAQSPGAGMSSGRRRQATLRLEPFEPLPPRGPRASSARRASDSSASTSPTRRRTSSASRLSGVEQRQLGLALAAEHREIDLDPAEPARLAERPRLGLDLRRGEDPATGSASAGSRWITSR